MYKFHMSETVSHSRITCLNASKLVFRQKANKSQSKINALMPFMIASLHLGRVSNFIRDEPPPLVEKDAKV